tara:strand:+ start:306 stop:767 length:462 start_codon:yes stop_codon:yes gene_type:complete
MKNFIEEIDNIIFELDKQINDKIVGINYLEKLKFLLIDRIKSIDSKYNSNFEDDEINKKYGENNLNIKLKKYPSPVSIIKQVLLNDNLCIVISGSKIIEIYENQKSKNSNSLNLHKNMGLTLPKETIFSEKVSNNTKLIEINNINENSYVEKQ